MTVNIPRITLLIEALENLPPKHRFDIDSFAARDSDHTCGTTACALGWGALTPSLMAQGFRLYGNSPHVNYPEVRGPRRVVKSVEDMVNFPPGSSFEVGMYDSDGDCIGDDDEFFGFPRPWVNDERRDQWSMHFTDAGYGHLGRPPTAKDVAAKLRVTFNITA